MTPWFATPPCFHVLNFNLSQTWHTIRFEKDTRYYSMCIEKDLLDDWVITVINGRIQTKLGQIRTLAFTCYSDAFDHFCNMIQVRFKRHYHLKFYQGGNPLLLKLIMYISISAIEDQLPNIIQRMPSTKTKAKLLSPNITHPTSIQLGFAF